MKYETGREHLWRGRKQLVYEYDAAILQRSFLRRLQFMTPPAVVAGSYPAAMYLHVEGKELSWRASNIDIFTFNAVQYTETLSLYENIVVANIRMQCKVFS